MQRNALLAISFVLVPLGLALSRAPSLMGQDSSDPPVCPAGRIIEVLVENRSIFDPAALREAGRLLWAYELANAVHVTTREDFIRDALLFRAGDCFDRGAVEESARILREYRFLGDAEIILLPPDADDRVILVRTRDEWTTKLALNLRLDDEIRIEGASLFEENFLGRGITVGVLGVNRGSRKEVGGSLEVPGFRGTGSDLLLRGGQGLVGGNLQAGVTRPFRGERPGVGIRQSFEYRRDLFAYVLPQGLEFSHITVRELNRRVELSATRRSGSPGDLYLVGAGLSHERVAVTAGDRAEGVVSGNFSDRDAAPSGLAEALDSQVSDRKAFRLTALAGLRRLRYESRRGLDAIAGLQDVPVGREATLVLGRSLGSTGAGRPGDLFGRASLLWGTSRGRTVAQVRVLAEGRREDSRPAERGMWRDVLTEGHGVVYRLPVHPAAPTLVVAGMLAGGWRTTAPFQLTLGGPGAMRGYSEYDLPGGRKAAASVEARFRGAGFLSELMDLGVTVFGDVGAVWKGDAPFGVDAGVRGSLGAGLRVGFPAGTSSVIRFDVAFPVGPGAGGAGPILRISAREWVGLSGDFRNLQVDRSRRSGLSGEYTGVARDGTIP